jgi:hypothetical protein
MGHWLAPPGAAKQLGHVKRFDARLWTVNFPRPMMACVVTTGPSSLRVDCVFYKADDLAGLIWEAEDRSIIPCSATRRAATSAAAGFPSGGGAAGWRSTRWTGRR